VQAAGHSVRFPEAAEIHTPTSSPAPGPPAGKGLGRPGSPPMWVRCVSSTAGSSAARQQSQGVRHDIRRARTHPSRRRRAPARRGRPGERSSGDLHVPPRRRSSRTTRRGSRNTGGERREGQPRLTDRPLTGGSIWCRRGNSVERRRGGVPAEDERHDEVGRTCSAPAADERRQASPVRHARSDDGAALRVWRSHLPRDRPALGR